VVIKFQKGKNLLDQLIEWLLFVPNKCT